MVDLGRFNFDIRKFVTGSNKTSGTNYRKDFAHGVKSTRSGGSSYSEDSQSRNNSPRMYHNKYAPITRSVGSALIKTEID